MTGFLSYTLLNQMYTSYIHIEYNSAGQHGVDPFLFPVRWPGKNSFASIFRVIFCCCLVSYACVLWILAHSVYTHIDIKPKLSGVFRPAKLNRYKTIPLFQCRVIYKRIVLVWHTHFWSIVFSIYRSGLYAASLALRRRVWTSE